MSPTEEDLQKARAFLEKTPLSALLEDMALFMATAAACEATSSARSALYNEILRLLRENLGECAICGAIGSHGKSYDQFTSNEKLAHQVEADRQIG
mgnify:CR=1 FL=1